MSNALFYIMAIIMLGGSWKVVTSKNLLHSVMSAFVVLMGTAVIYFMLNAQFLAVTQILIYAGGVTILILFVVMLTTADRVKYEVSFDNKIGIPMYIFTALVFSMLTFVILKIDWPYKGTLASLKNVTEVLAKKLFLEYLLPFEVASVLLLAALVGAVVLARKE